MNENTTTFSHHEIGLLLFALQGGEAAPMPDAASCELACPVIESVEELLCGGKLDTQQKLVRHLNNHLREALIESGLFELMAETSNNNAISAEQQSKFDLANQSLKHWRSDVRLTEDERKMLSEALNRMPRSAWLTMPRSLWRLKKKLRRK
jgi:hypothetical protein